MPGDSGRLERIAAVLRGTGLNALVCTLPANVLLLSGYWPVVGTAVCVVTDTGLSALVVPEDERDLAVRGWASEVRTYQPGSLHNLSGPSEAVREPLRALLSSLDISGGRLGFEAGNAYEEASYAAMYLYQASIQDVLKAAAPGAAPVSGAAAITALRSWMTVAEVERVHQACDVASAAFDVVARHLRPGMREPEVAAALASPMMVNGLRQPGVERAGAFTWCMSGENSALAGAAYARTRNRQLHPGDFVLVHCNSYIDGYWTDITRTYCLGEPDERQRAMYLAVFAARKAALTAIRPGALAADVDRAAREVLAGRGFGHYFTHGLGHNVGFSAISGEYPPRLHPASPDRLEVGMTFNVEPAIYIAGFGGLRQCDVVTVRENGADVLTPFQADIDQLIMRG